MPTEKAYIFGSRQEYLVSKTCGKSQSPQRQGLRAGGIFSLMGLLAHQPFDCAGGLLLFCGVCFRVHECVCHSFMHSFIHQFIHSYTHTYILRTHKYVMYAKAYGHIMFKGCAKSGIYRRLYRSLMSSTQLWPQGSGNGAVGREYLGVSIDLGSHVQLKAPHFGDLPFIIIKRKVHWPGPIHATRPVLLLSHPELKWATCRAIRRSIVSIV